MILRLGRALQAFINEQSIAIAPVVETKILVQVEIEVKALHTRIGNQPWLSTVTVLGHLRLVEELLLALFANGHYEALPLLRTQMALEVVRGDEV